MRRAISQFVQTINANPHDLPQNLINIPVLNWWRIVALTGTAPYVIPQHTT